MSGKNCVQICRENLHSIGPKIAFSGRLNTGANIQITPKVLPKFASIRSETVQKFERNLAESGKSSNCSHILGRFALIYLMLDVAKRD